MILSLLPYWITHRFFNPTRAWPPRSISSLSYDMGRHALNGVAIESPLGDARVFGPADHVDRLAGIDLVYFGLGLEIGAWKGAITHFHLIMEPANRPQPWAPRCQPATLAVSTGSGSFRLSSHCNEGEMIRVFGQPAESGPVGGERVHTFMVGGNFIDSYHEPTTGRLVEMELCLTNQASLPAA